MTFKNPHLRSQWDETLKILARFTRQQIAEIYSLENKKKERGPRLNLPPHGEKG